MMSKSDYMHAGKRRAIAPLPLDLKLSLVTAQSMNPRWDDLATDWQDVYKPRPAVHRGEIPRPAGEGAGLRDDAAEL